MLAGCGAKAPAGPQHIAILRFENLSADGSADWAGRAFSEIIAGELPSAQAISSVRLHSLDRTLGVRPISAPGISTERTAAIVAGANRIGYGDYTVHGGQVDARLTIEDPQTGKVTQVARASAGDVLTAASRLAKQLSPAATSFETSNPEAVRYYMTALESSIPAEMEKNAAAAIAADPNFGQPYRLMADVKTQQRDRDGALAALDQALARGTAIPALERARIQLQAAGLRNDFAGRERALGELAKADPTDVDSWSALGQTAYARHDYAKAVDAYRKALQIRPDDTNTLNLLGYALAWSGDMDGALGSLRKYQAAAPKDANALDSEGDVNLMFGRLREAEDLYLQADKLDRKRLEGGDLFKAAMARLMSGDVAGASLLDKQFTDAREALKDPAVPIYQAEWLWISGNHTAAKTQMQSITAPSIAGRAYVDLAIWSLLDGDRAAGAQWALKASGAATQATAVDTIVARFVAQPSAPAAEWSARADQLFRNVQQTEVKDLTLSYALLLDRHFAEAAEVLRRVYNGPSPDPGIPVLLAWSLMESGHSAEAGPLLRFNPVPAATGIGPYTPFWYPRFLELRKKLQK